MLKPELETFFTYKAYLASKWNHQQALLDDVELSQLFSCLGATWLFPIGKVLQLTDTAFSIEAFLQDYKKVVASLKTKKVEGDLLRKFLPCAITQDVNNLYLLKANDQWIVKIQKPVILMQPHTFYFSHQDKKFRSMVLSPHRVFWGFRFSYPQIYQDPESREYFKVDQTFSSTELFFKLRKWIRTYTLPTPFLIEREKINVPIRLGRKCFEWINQHPELKRENLKVVYAN